MAYVVVSFKGKEVGRWPLTDTLTIGRSGECHVAVRDILLSRKHLEIVPEGKSWIAVDLDSKNGTKVRGSAVTRKTLRDGDVLSMGKTTIRFQRGRLPGEYRAPTKRPSDPFEALSNTVSDFDPAAADAYCREKGLPKPQPIPPEPAAYAKDDLYSLLTEIASSSWDSIYAQASQPKRPIPRNGSQVGRDAGGTATMAPPMRRSRFAFSEELQVEEVRPQRPATPLKLLPIQVPVAATAVEEFSLPHRYAFRRRRTVASFVSALARPLVALHRWVAPAGRVRLF